MHTIKTVNALTCLVYLHALYTGSGECMMIYLNSGLLQLGAKFTRDRNVFFCYLLFLFRIISVQYMYHNLSITIYLTMAQYFIRNENQHDRGDRRATVYTF